MKVLQINTKYQGGGAERVARQLYQKMPEYGVESVFLAGRNQKKDPNIYTVYESPLMRGYNYLNRKLHNNAIEHDPYAVKRILECIRKEEPDIVHFHNIHGHYMGICDIAQIARIKPVVWTLHDVWALTGHCCIGGCFAWRDDGCKCCERLDTYSQLIKDDAARLLQVKKSVFAQNGIFFVTPSLWLENLVKDSYLREENVRTIYNGVDLKQFDNLDKREVRRKHNIPDNKKVLMFLGTPLNNEIKGIQYLLPALELLDRKEDYFLLMVGNCIDLEGIKAQFMHKDFGYVSDARMLNEIYSAADVFLFPSIHESAGLMAIEAGACGTTCIAFASEAIPELVTDEVGWLIEPKDYRALASTIESAVKDETALEQKGKRFRTYVKDTYSEEKMIKDYIAIYHEAINEFKRKKKNN